MSLKLKCHLNLNVTKTQLSPILPDLTLIQQNLSTKKHEINTDCLGLVLLYNHLLGPYACRRPPMLEFQEKGKENKGNKHTRQTFLHGSKKIAAMDSLLFL